MSAVSRPEVGVRFESKAGKIEEYSIGQPLAVSISDARQLTKFPIEPLGKAAQNFLIDWLAAKIFTVPKAIAAAEDLV